MSLNYTLVRTKDGKEQVILDIEERRDPLVADDSHPAWAKIKAGLIADDPNTEELFNLAVMLTNRLSLTERISTDRNRLYLDGDPVDDALGVHIVKVLNEHWDEGGDLTAHVKPLIKLLENIAQNPSQHSRQQLYNYVKRHHLTTTDEGYLVLYKYVYRATSGSTDSSKPYQSGNSGPAIVNGVPVNGYVGQDIGDVVEMPRSQVTDDPNTACASGLHVGAWAYVGHNGHVRLEIYVHPRDVVSVPRDASEQKIRVCRYRVVREITKPYTESVIPHEAAPVSTVVALAAASPAEAESEALTSAQLAAYRLAARVQKKSIKAYMTRKGYTLADGQDGSQPDHWAKAA